MGWFTAFVLYILIWWVVLFAVLPIGIQPQEAPDELTGWRGAPRHAGMPRKLVVTSLVALIVWGVCAGVIASPFLSFRHGWLALPPDR